MKLITCIVIAFSTAFPFSLNQNEITKVKGYAPEYSGNTIVFFSYLERQFDSRINIATAEVDAEGFFSFSFNCPDTRVLYFETPLYTGYFYTERGRNYTISLPSPQVNISGNHLSPFFVSPYWHIIPADSLVYGLQDLNYAIRDYDLIYDTFINKQISRYYDIEKSKLMLDSFLQYNPLITEVSDETFFSDYIRYKIARLELLTREHDMSGLYIKYFKEKPLAMNNPAFWDFYRLYFDRYISSLTDRKGFKEIYQLMGKELYDSLTLLLKNDPVLNNDTIRELVLMNELYKGFYEKNYPLLLTINLLDTIHTRSGSLLTKNAAIRIRDSIMSLQPGYYPPPFTVKNPDGKVFTVQDFKGKYVYLGFCSLNHLGSLKEIEYLKYQNNKHRNYLQIITIVPEPEKDEIKSFIESNSISWPVLFSTDNSNLFRDYKVKGFPLFYLLDKEGKLILSPSPLPSENFESALFRVMRAKGDI